MTRTAVLLAASLLAACGEATPPPPGNTAEPAPEATAAPASAPTASPEPVSGDGQNFTMPADPDGELKIVGSETQYDILLPTDLLFDFDRAELRPEAEPMLMKVKAHLDEHGSDQLHVVGHADAKGEDQYNFRLFMRRAAAVCGWFKEHGERSTNCIGRGEREPVAPNAKPDGSDDPVGRQRNRRVAIRVVKYPDADAMMENAQRQARGAGVGK